MTQSRHIDALVSYALAEGLIAPPDRTYAINRLLAVLGETAYVPGAPPTPFARAETPSPQLLLDALSPHGGRAERELLHTELMAALTPPPSQVIESFRSLYASSPFEATDWYYRFSQATNYIHTDRTANDIRWTAHTKYGPLLLSINLSKPEILPGKPSETPAAYPACPLCPENEGFRGAPSQAARGNHRILPLTIGGEAWFWQYSPYVYYNEHCIALNQRHTPMRITPATFGKLLDFTDLFPHYFIGSNTDLPRVGGSILAHEHFQGGHAAFPMEKAKVLYTYDLPDVSCGILDWPMSALRLTAAEREPLLALAARIFTRWQQYSDAQADILAFSGATPHNTLSPIARRRNGRYELDLVLRNNRATDAHPGGLFHAHADKHHIKRENIGLIETLGLAVLPPRLKPALAALADFWAGGADCFAENPALLQHKPWFDALSAQKSPHSRAEATQFLQAAAGDVFAACLEDAGVFKQTPAGRAAFTRFLETALR